MPNTNLNEDQVFAAFIDRLLQTKGITKDTNPEQYQTQSEQLRIELDDAIQREVLNSLSTEQLEQLEQMFDANATDQDIEQFFDQANINYEQAVITAMKKFREEKGETNTNTEQPTAGNQPTDQAEPAANSNDMTNTFDNNSMLTVEEA